MASELEAEQEFVDLAYARLDAMRGDANSMLEGVLDLGKGGTFQSRTERDVIVRTSLARLEQLDIGDQALTFGRIDRLAAGAGDRTTPAPTARTADRVPRPSTSVAWPSTVPTTSRWWSTGGPRWPSPSTGPPAATPRDSSSAATSPSRAGTVIRVEDERFALPEEGGELIEDRAYGTGGEATVGRAHRRRPAHRRPGRPAGRAGPGPDRAG